jgi:1-acyl-sn-glycerol-3-phosphate acyltransferase
MNRSVDWARLRLTAFWIAVFARAFGENAVRAYAVLRMNQGDIERMAGFVFLWLGLTAVPAFALAPLIGALASSRHRRSIMVLATLAGLAIIAWTSLDDYRNNFRTDASSWYSLIGVLAFESAFFSACRFAILPEAARRARLALPPVIGIFAFATVAGLVAGAWIAVDQFAVGKPGLPVPLGFGLIGYGAALLCILSADFPAEKPLRVGDGLIGPFLRTARAIFRVRYSRYSLLALCGLFAVGLDVYQWLMPTDLQMHFLLALAAGVAVGSLKFHPHRTLGLVPYAAIGLAGAAVWAVAANDWRGPALALAFFIGVMTPPLLTIYTIHQPDESRGHGGALLHAGWSTITGAFIVFLLAFINDFPGSQAILSDAVLGLGLAGLIAAWLVFFRAALEITIEVMITPIYRIKATGPGVPLLPLKGPALMIANHAAWFDPFWLAKVVPCPIKPMMTSRFYDLPVISWLARKVIGAIRVPDTPLRKEAPEIKEAIALLDRGDYVVLFPEGWLRRKEEQELRRFARGVWHILKARPSTPVFPCWIDGGWGSMVSHKNGPPLKNKKFDKWRKIRIAIGLPLHLNPSILQTHMATRTELMKAVLEARSLLGLPPIDPFKLEAHEDGDDKHAEASPEGHA